MSLAPSSLLRWLPLALIALAALWLRTRDLEHRPMHADEANQAVKLGELLEQGRYAFDPRDHHGPTLYYAAVPIAWARGERTLAQLTETTIRLVPAIFGTLAVVLVAALATSFRPAASGPTQSAIRSPQSEIDWPALAAAAFVAVSPPAVYYSRYFIQETLLVTVTLAAFVCAARWWATRRLSWAIAAGACVGLMQATKATAPLFVIAGLAACAVGRASARPRTSFPAASTGKSGLKPALPQLALALLAGLFTAALFYSSFFTNLSGLSDAFGAYAHALTRFGEAAAPTGHEKAWWYFLRMLGWYREGGLVWHQLALSALALAGLAVAFARPEPLPRWAAAYTVLVLGAFSIFSYKTPWHAVHFVPGMALLAAGTLTALGTLLTGKFVAIAAALLVLATQYQQTNRAAFLRPGDARNPYAYVHSSPDVKKYRALAQAAVAEFPQQPVRVISEEYWPLPWYLRGLPAGFWTTPPDDCDGALVIASATQAEAVRARLRGQYRESFLGLRPGFACVIFTREGTRVP